MKVRYLHTMVRVKDLDKSIAFWKLLGLEETRRITNDKGRFTLVFMAPPGQPDCPVELTYNWDGDEGLPSDGRHFGHLAYDVENIYDMCALSAGEWGGHQPPAARRADGLRALARQPVGGTAAMGRCLAAAGGTVGQHAQCRAIGEEKRLGLAPLIAASAWPVGDESDPSGGRAVIL